MIIRKLTGIIQKYIDLSASSREFVLTLSDDLDFLPGAFINVFAEVNGEKVRRAYSISSPPNNPREVTLSIKKTPGGIMSSFLWDESILGTELEIMGPLGLNTIDTITPGKVFLFGFGIGVSVIKPIAEILSRDTSREIYICTGSRSEDEILYKSIFDALAQTNPNVHVRYIVSRPKSPGVWMRGHIQDHIDDYDFNNSHVYICGQEQACTDLSEYIQKKNPLNCTFSIEGFH